jgi:hypothetical protein
MKMLVSVRTFKRIGFIVTLFTATSIYAADTATGIIGILAIHAPDQTYLGLERPCLFVLGTDGTWYAKLKTDANYSEVRESIYLARSARAQVDLLVKSGVTVCPDAVGSPGYPAIDSLTLY